MAPPPSPWLRTLQSWRALLLAASATLAVLLLSKIDRRTDQVDVRLEYYTAATHASKHFGNGEGRCRFRVDPARWKNHFRGTPLIDRPYDLCLPRKGSALAKAVRRTGIKDPEITAALLGALKRHEKGGGGTVAFLDLGANVGLHSIPVARAGYHTWAVEPDRTNLAMLYAGATMSGVLDRLHLVEGMVGETRGGEVKFRMVPNAHQLNHALSEEKSGRMRPGEYVTVRSHLLADVLDEMAEWSKKKQREEKSPLAVVIKADIQFSECRAFLGSADRIVEANGRDFFVAYIVMEWVFLKKQNQKLGASDLCPPAMLRRLVDFFVSAGYSPRTVDGRRKLDPREYEKWGEADVAWVHRNANY